MFVDDFKFQYETIPFATTFRDHKKCILTRDIETLSHMHREIEILLVLDGTAGLTVNGNKYKINKGDIVVIPPYFLHNYTILANCDFKHKCLCFDVKLIYDKELCNGLEKGKTIIPFIFRNEKCSSYVMEAFNLNAVKNKGWELQVIGNLSLFFGVLQEENLIAKTTEFLQKNIYRDIMDMIIVNYPSSITSSDIAKKLHINNSYFCRLFKKHFGCPFQNYLCAYRIEKAKLYLKNTDLSVSEIAFNTGFNSISYFGKIFKEMVGLTPVEYRKNFICFNA